MTWQQTEAKRYDDRLRERWNEDGTRKPDLHVLVTPNGEQVSDPFELSRGIAIPVNRPLQSITMTWHEKENERYKALLEERWTKDGRQRTFAPNPRCIRCDLTIAECRCPININITDMLSPHYSGDFLRGKL